ncbi:PilT protein domain protein [Rhodovulum sp. PH10]|uniref:type II toxin-antitoxin system VapC family toxin n=1 Tax=Rhodovulum sp. PH10 TaxID=1187851 RepID=UPI00027C28C3|nr:type II toxin-antitoxin system VapC family toxin [Rhodovulum sp. PH10]EJW12600.1 PilT protein domain protein [Rhodovulum sp. PH10]
MILDTSALIAILKGEPDAKRFTDAIEAASIRRLSAATYLEVAIVADRNGNPLIALRLDEMLREAAVTIEPVTPEQARIARQAYRDFGKGSGHPARLNFGDCFGYALARATGEPLLFKGDDFSHTDLTPAISGSGRGSGEP